jgi:Aspartyl/Asparaginyl beta-hydroxylase
MGAPPPADDRHLSPEQEEGSDESNNVIINDYDEEATELFMDTVPNLVSELETLLRMLEVAEGTTFYPIPDMAWLRCASMAAPTSSGVTGLPDSDCHMSVEYYHCDESILPSVPADTSLMRQYEEVAVSVVRWVDARVNPPSMTTRQEIVLFLRSIFEDIPPACEDVDAVRNRHSPWYSSSSSSSSSAPTEDADCIIIVFPRRNEPMNELLSLFVISDICPAYALFSSVDVSTSRLRDDARECSDSWLFPFGVESTEAQLFVYRRLPPRMFLTSFHPTTQAPVPTEGCLWETVFTYSKAAEGENDDSKEPVARKKPDISYRLVGPPYMDVSELDSSLHSLRTLLQPEVRAVLQREVERIADFFIAWPEPQHYEAEATTTWNVFPLCHTFPGHDISKRQWIPRTCAYVPETAALLRDCFAPSPDGRHPQWLLRTALYSRLAPDAVLQAHTGWADLANSVIRVHIPIVLPVEAETLCGTWVDGCVRRHAYGEMILFDDSKIHRAYNYSHTQARTVLILDLLRPEHWPPGTAAGGHSPELDDFIAQFQEESVEC